MTAREEQHAFRAMGTDWWVAWCGAPAGLAAEVEALVRTEEARFSRFREDSLLSTLNRDRAVEDATFAEVVRLALAIRDVTAGAFDPAIADDLVAAGYARPFETLGGSVAVLAPPRLRPALRTDEDRVWLDGDGRIDLGGIVKGWTVDRVAAALAAAGATSGLVDGGGDIRALGAQPDGSPWPVEAGDGLAVLLTGDAVCTSSTLRRRWTTAEGAAAHHIIDPDTGWSADAGVAIAVVAAPTAAVADALATALVASPERALAAVPALEADVLLLTPDGWRMSAGFERRLA